MSAEISRLSTTGMGSVILCVFPSIKETPAREAEHEILITIVSRGMKRRNDLALVDTPKAWRPGIYPISASNFLNSSITLAV